MKLHPSVRTALEVLAKKKGLTKTQVIEEGIQLQMLKIAGRRVRID
jgi:hypothetical protein